MGGCSQPPTAAPYRSSGTPGARFPGTNGALNTHVGFRLNQQLPLMGYFCNHRKIAGFVGLFFLISTAGTHHLVVQPVHFLGSICFPPLTSVFLSRITRSTCPPGAAGMAFPGSSLAGLSHLEESPGLVGALQESHRNPGAVHCIALHCPIAPFSLPILAPTLGSFGPHSRPFSPQLLHPPSCVLQEMAVSAWGGLLWGGGGRRWYYGMEIQAGAQFHGGGAVLWT